MSRSGSRVLILVVCATALVMVPMGMSAKAANSSQEEQSRKRTQTSPSAGDPRSTGRAGASCSRGIDCATWPPPLYDDPDRKTGGAGGM